MPPRKTETFFKILPIIIFPLLITLSYLLRMKKLLSAVRTHYKTTINFDKENKLSKSINKTFKIRFYIYCINSKNAVYKHFFLITFCSFNKKFYRIKVT